MKKQHQQVGDGASKSHTTKQQPVYTTRFTGSMVLYGRGFWSVFFQLFKCIIPFIKKGFIIAKPHLKLAAKNIALDIIRAALSDDQQQEGFVTTSQETV